MCAVCRAQVAARRAEKRKKPPKGALAPKKKQRRFGDELDGNARPLAPEPARWDDPNLSQNTLDVRRRATAKDRDNRFRLRNGLPPAPSPLPEPVAPATLIDLYGTPVELPYNYPPLNPRPNAPVAGKDWENVKKFHAALDTHEMEDCSRCQERWFEMEPNGDGICKRCVNHDKGVLPGDG